MPYSRKELNEISRKNSYKRKFTDNAAKSLIINDSLKQFILDNIFFDIKYINTTLIKKDITHVSNLLENMDKKRWEFAKGITSFFFIILILYYRSRFSF